MKPWHLAILLVMNCFWAGSLTIYNALSEHLHAGPIVTLRFGVAALILAIAWPWLPGKAPRGWYLLKTMLLGCVVFMLGHRLQVYGDKLGGAGDSSVLMGMEPIITSVAAAIFLREQIGPRRWVGCVIAFFGVVLLNGLKGGGFQWSGFVASMIFISSFFCEAAYSIFGKGLIEHGGMVKILAIALFAGTVANLLIDGGETLAAVRTMPPRDWLLILYLATLCTSIGYAVWFAVIKVTDVNVTALTIFAQPVAGVIIAAVFLHESLHWGQFWGSVAIVAGLVLGLSRQMKPGVDAAHS